MLELAGPEKSSKGALGEPQSDSESLPDGPVQALNYIDVDEPERAEVFSIELDEPVGDEAFNEDAFVMGRPAGSDDSWY